MAQNFLLALRKIRTSIWISVAGTLLIVLTAIIYVKVEADRGARAPLRDELISKGNGATELVVVIHGYNGSAQSMADVRQAISEARPNVDLLLFGYAGRPFSNGNCFRIAEQMCQRIQEYQNHRHYEKITLVGFSIGALLVRKAYVYGCGHIEDLYPDERAPVESRAAQEWVTKVDRFVLLAGMNRGWTTRDRPSGMKWYRSLLFKAGTTFARWTDTAQLIRQCEQGDPFVANLRIQWLDTVRSMPPEQRPAVIQLLGSDDDVVSRDDNRDVNVSRDFIWVQLKGTGHAQAIVFQNSTFAKERRAKFIQALGPQETVEQLRRASTKIPDDTDPDVTTLVIILHGIRDMGQWTSQFEEPLQKVFQQSNPGGAKLRVYHPSYGYFAMGPFLLWSDRQANVRWFMDEYTDLKAKYPNLHEVDLIGHSNGTYVVASALAKYKTLKVNRVVLAGSVLRRDFDWNALRDRITGIRNYVGSEDWVVGFFPRLFEFSLFSMLNHDIGSAGFNGFEQAIANTSETKFISGGHGAALQTENIPSVVSFIMKGEKIENPKLLVSKHPGWLDYLSRMAWIVWFAIIVVLVFVGKLWFRMANRRLGKLFRPRLASVLSFTSYLFLVWLLLVTI